MSIESPVGTLDIKNAVYPRAKTLVPGPTLSECTAPHSLNVPKNNLPSY